MSNESIFLRQERIKTTLTNIQQMPKINWNGIRAVFNWLSKNQNQSNYSDQLQPEQTAP